MMTLTYPENYALLTMEEMTYTTGGDAEGDAPRTLLDILASLDGMRAAGFRR